MSELNYLVTLNGEEIYRTDAMPILRPGEQCFALDPDESPEALQARINSGEMYTVNTLKVVKTARILADCQAAMDAGFTTPSGIKMDSNLTALQKIKIGYDFAVIMGETTMTVVDFDNVEHLDLPMLDVLTLMLQTGGYYRELYMRKQTLRAQVLAATTLEELGLIAW